MPKLCLQIPTPTVQGQCTMDELARDICLCFSISPSTSLCGSQSTANVSNPHPSGFHVGQTTMVHHAIWTLSGSTSDTSQLAVPSKPGNSKVSKFQISQSCDLAHQVLEFEYLSLLQECVEILKESRRPTTRACYTPKWKRFLHYCHYKDINTLTAQVQDIVFSLLYLQNSGLALTSIKYP